MVLDAEKIQKIGKLASELLSHGRATDIQDAMRQAEAMLGSTGAIPPNERTPVPDPSPHLGAATNAPAQAAKQQDPEYDFKLMKLQRQMDQQKEMLMALRTTLAGFASKIDNVIGKINKLEQQQKPIILEKPKAQPQTTLKPEPKQPHARSGGYSPGDSSVSVENIFYSGPK